MSKMARKCPERERHRADSFQPCPHLT
jgi:hypothetical protein